MASYRQWFKRWSHQKIGINGEKIDATAYGQLPELVLQSEPEPMVVSKK